MSTFEIDPHIRLFVGPDQMFVYISLDERIYVGGHENMRLIPGFNLNDGRQRRIPTMYFIKTDEQEFRAPTREHFANPTVSPAMWGLMPLACLNLSDYDINETAERVTIYKKAPAHPFYMMSE